MSQVVQINGDYTLKVADGGKITLDTGLSGTVEITGNLQVEGNITLKGTINIGDQNNDNVIFNGEVASHILPDTTDFYDLGSETQAWRTLYVNEITGKSGGTVRISNLDDPLNPQDAATKNYVDRFIAQVETPVDNVIYVAMNGTDDIESGYGPSLARPLRSIKVALELATQLRQNSLGDSTPGANAVTIFVKSGDYTEVNPLFIPEGVTIWGDNLRAVTVRPLNKTRDLFWVSNGVYLGQMTFKDVEAPAAGVAFADPADPAYLPEYAAGVIHTSPYVQSCTMMTTTGTGMRVDGAHSSGLRSMVVDAYTQYNQGGIGIHMLNRGNTQLVSVFTICCEVSILCEKGGFCSLTNSNTSFGTYGLKADGVSDPIYSGKLALEGPTGVSGNIITVKNLTTKPSAGTAVSLGSSPSSYYTVFSATPLAIGTVEIETPAVTNQPTDAKNLRQIILSNKEKIKIDVIDYLNETYPDLEFNQFKCSRDVGIILDSIADDMVFNGNYRTIQSGISYTKSTATVVISDQKPETVDAINFAKAAVLTLVDDGSTMLANQPEYINIENNFNKIVEIIENGIPGQDYDQVKCARDVRYIVDALRYDLMFGSNFRTVTAARSYYRANAAEVVGAQKELTLAALTYLKLLAASTVAGNVTAVSSVTNNMDMLINVFDTGLTAIPAYTTPTPTGGTANANVAGYLNARNLVEANRNFIVANTVAYILPIAAAQSITFDQAKCERDLRYILDAVYYDTTYGTNLESIVAGNAYYVGAMLMIPAAQKALTIDFFTYLRNTLGDIAQNISVTPTQITQTQVSGTAGSLAAANKIKSLIDDIISILDTQTQPAVVEPDTTWPNAGLVTKNQALNTAKTVIGDQVNSYVLSSNLAFDYAFTSPVGVNADRARAKDILIANRDYLIEEGIAYISANAPSLVYDRTTCRRDIGYVVDAITYDVLYGGNSQRANAADEYYSSGYLQIAVGEKQATINTFVYLKSVSEQIVINTSVASINTVISQNTSLASASPTEVFLVGQLFDIVIEIVTNAYTSEITLEERVPDTFPFDTIVDFRQYSRITASSQTFEWVGAGNDVNTALPYLGGEAVVENQVVAINGGKVYYTGTDQRGDFRIGSDLIINRNNGTISGRTFTKSLFAVMTPYILAIGE